MISYFYSFILVINRIILYYAWMKNRLRLFVDISQILKELLEKWRR